MHRYVISICMLWLSMSIFAVQAKELILAASTSTKSSGLLDKLIPEFEELSGYKIKVFSVGSGKALRMGSKGKADVLIVHAPDAEKKFIEQEHGVLRKPMMKNDFVIVGPKNDPARLRGLSDVKQAFINIKKSRSQFISRADDSGTHKKEMSIWDACEIEPYGDWYYELGAGTVQTLRMANSKQGYMMIDRGTWLVSRSTMDLMLFIEKDPDLENPYHILAINPERHEKADYHGAKKFIKWVTGERGQEIINQLKVDGEQLFTAAKN